MSRFASALRDRLEVAEGTMAFVFDRPTGFEFTAGQYVNLILPNPPHTDAGGSRRTFSIASPPHETADLRVATRMTGSAMKRSLAEVGLGTPVEILGPAGSFTLHPDGSVPAVFIAGGIGITPFRSMVHDAVRRRLPHRITLIYSNRNPEGAAFHAEIAQLVKTWPSLAYVPTMTKADTSGQAWSGERRYVTSIATPAAARATTSTWGSTRTPPRHSASSANCRPRNSSKWRSSSSFASSRTEFPSTPPRQPRTPSA